MTSSPKDVEGLVSFASRVLAGADALASVAPRLTGQDPGQHVLAGDAPGRLGELCRHLHSQLAGALSARGQEATAHSERLLQTAVDLGRIAADHADIDVTLSTKVKKTQDDDPAAPSSSTLDAGPGRDAVIEAG